MYDHRNDIIITIGLIISIILTKYNLYILDYIVGIIISLSIAYTGLKICIESYNILMCKKVINKEITKTFGTNIDVINMGEDYIVIMYINKYKNLKIENIYNTSLLEKYNISQLLIRYM